VIVRNSVVGPETSARNRRDRAPDDPKEVWDCDCLALPHRGMFRLGL